MTDPINWNTRQLFDAIHEGVGLLTDTTTIATDHPLHPMVGVLSNIFLPFRNTVGIVTFYYYIAWFGFFYFIAYFGWLWVLHAWGFINMDWIWDAFVPKNDAGEYTFEDDFSEINSWSLYYTMKIIEKDFGTDFDPYNEKHLEAMDSYTWSYIFDQVFPALAFCNTMGVMVVPFFLNSDSFLDADGYALDGLPNMYARSLG